jgi:allophanate hydrolase subunit 1
MSHSLAKQKNYELLVDISLSLKQLQVDLDEMKTDISQIKNDIRVKTIQDMVEPKVNTTKEEEYSGGWRLW